MSAESYRSKVKEIISRLIKIPANQIGDDDDLVDKLGMDSMTRVEIVIELEKEFDVEIEDNVAIQIRSVNKCLEIIDSLITKK